MGEGVEGWKRTGGDARARSRGAGQYGARAVALGRPGRDGAPRAVMSPPRASEQAVMPGVKSTPGKQAEGDARVEPPPPCPGYFVYYMITDTAIFVVQKKRAKKMTIS